MEGYFEQTCIIEGCGISWFQPTPFNEQRRKDHRLFYCPNGHGQYYPQENEKEKLRRKVEILERNLSSKECDLKYCKDSRRSLKGQITKLKKKIK